MKSRDIWKTAEKIKGNTPDLYDITLGDLFDPKERLDRDGDWYTAFTTAFQYGFVLGSRATKAGKVKKL